MSVQRQLENDLQKKLEKAFTAKVPKYLRRQDDAASTDGTGWTRTDAKRLRVINRNRKARGKTGEVTSRETAPGSGQWDFVYPNGKTKPSPSSRKGLV